MKTFFKLLLFIILNLQNLNLFADKFLVPQQYLTIGDALTDCNDFDTVIVSQGIYFEKIVWPQKIGIVLISSSGAGQTFIDGSNNQTHPLISIVGTSQPFFHPTLTIKGFTLQNSQILLTTTGNFNIGACLNIQNADPVIEDCIIKNNRCEAVSGVNASAFGGAINILLSSVKMSNCHITKNGLYYVKDGLGSAILAGISTVTLENCLVDSNDIISKREAIGTIHCSNSILTISKCIIKDNYLQVYSSSINGGRIIEAGAIFFQALIKPLTIENTLIVNNRFDPFLTTMNNVGGAISYYGKLRITHCTFADNKRVDGGYIKGKSIHHYGYTSGKKEYVRNSILWNPGSTGTEIFLDSAQYPVTVNYSNVKGGANGNGNINKDPKFISSNDYHLSLTSPCLNEGNLAFALSEDLDGNPRPMPGWTNPDLGCFELNQLYTGVNHSNTEQTSILLHFNQHASQLYLFGEKSNTVFMIEIFDASGRLIMHSEKNKSQPFQLPNLASGQYNCIIHFIDSTFTTARFTAN